MNQICVQSKINFHENKVNSQVDNNVMSLCDLKTFFFFSSSTVHHFRNFFADRLEAWVKENAL